MKTAPFKTGRKDPGNLIQTVKIISKNNKNMKLFIVPKKVIYNKITKKFIVKSYFAYIPTFSYGKSDIDTLDIMIKLKHFCNMCNNRVDLFNTIMEAYENNDNLFKISFKILPDSVSDEKIEYFSSILDK